MWADEAYGLFYLGVVEALHHVEIDGVTVVSDGVVEVEWIDFGLPVEGGEAGGDERVGHRVVLSSGCVVVPTGSHDGCGGVSRSRLRSTVVSVSCGCGIGCGVYHLSLYGLSQRLK